MGGDEFTYNGVRYTLVDGVPVPSARDRGDHAGVSWMSIRDAVRVYGFPRASIEKSMASGDIRSLRLARQGPFPSVFVSAEDMAAWAKHRHIRPDMRAHMAQPEADPAPTPEHILKQIKRGRR